MKHTNDILVIDRDQWARGQGNACLLSPSDSSMCCLGFDALQLGVPEDAVAERQVPWQLRDSYPAHAKGRRMLCGSTSSDLVERAIEINDDRMLTDAERERKLRPVLKALGWSAVIFVGGSQEAGS